VKNQIFKAGKIVLCLAILSSCCGRNSNQSVYNDDGQQIFIGENIAVAKTEYGTVKGFMVRGINVFQGIPYGAPTSGKNRFMPPQPPEPWKGVKPAVAYGASAPQDMYDRNPEAYGMFVDHWNYDLIGEDCLRLNVWTPGIADGKKRPVLVWMHGGRFARGNGIEQDGYNGENFSRYGDVVFVSINHRLNGFGFSDLSKAGGEKYKHSGNAGMLDIVASLQWVNRNIANFGGDPDNVTIMGQSGGGSKVCNIAAMPAAKGLVHKGVALSGYSTAGNNKEFAEGLGKLIIAEAGLKPNEVDKLQELPWEEYLVIANRAVNKYRADYGGGHGTFSPQADGFNIPTGIFFNPNDTSIPNIPMIFCTTFNENPINRDDASLDDISFEGVAERLSQNYDNAAEIVDAYHKLFPEMRPIEIWSMIASSRSEVVYTADVKAAQGAPVYMAWFGMGSPLFDGRHRAFHCSDISFWLRNTDLMMTHTGGGKRPRILADKMSEALLNFMRTGDPNTDKLPVWTKYTSQNGETMIFNEVCEVKNDPDRSARKLLNK
jgi:para-nitrobenzyl esterase